LAGENFAFNADAKAGIAFAGVGLLKWVLLSLMVFSSFRKLLF